MENMSCGVEARSFFTKVVLPEPDGAVITIILFVAKSLCLRFANNGKKCGIN